MKTVDISLYSMVHAWLDPAMFMVKQYKQLILLILKDLSIYLEGPLSSISQTAIIKLGIFTIYNLGLFWLYL